MKERFNDTYEQACLVHENLDGESISLSDRGASRPDAFAGLLHPPRALSGRAP